MNWGQNIFTKKQSFRLKNGRKYDDLSSTQFKEIMAKCNWRYLFSILQQQCLTVERESIKPVSLSCLCCPTKLFFIIVAREKKKRKGIVVAAFFLLWSRNGKKREEKHESVAYISFFLWEEREREKEIFMVGERDTPTSHKTSMVLFPFAFFVETKPFPFERTLSLEMTQQVISGLYLLRIPLKKQAKFFFHLFSKLN